jgi:radical SAM enzyme (TIGR01210 family)
VSAAEDRRIRSLRPPKPHVDPYVAHGTLLEEERRPDGRIERALTVFLAGAECPFTCAFCDLWRYTIDGPTPRGALPRQLDRALAAHTGPTPDRLKLYTASNFFDRRAVPPEDLDDLARLAAPFGAVTVESHASTVGDAAAAFARRLRGRLEVAMGLETIHPEATSRLNKRLDLDRFDRAARRLRSDGIELRAFVLLGAPHVPACESVAWTTRTVAYAAERGAAVAAIIPVRGGNGELERLQALGAFTPPTLAELEEALDASIAQEGTVVTADLWDAERLPACAACGAARIARMARMNLGGRTEPRVACAACGARGRAGA